MINAQVKLVAPRRLETFYTDVGMDETHVLVRPRMLSICKADIRYFFGIRDAKVLAERLPLTLIHEAAGSVLYDPSGQMSVGESVILLPNIPGDDPRTEENYRLSSRFRSSRADGFMQEIMSLPMREVLPYHDIPLSVAAFTEFISVGVHAVDTYKKRRKNPPRRIGVWGDGGLGYIVGSLLKYYMPDTVVVVIGVSKSKLQMFRFADETYTIDEIEKGKIWFDDAFECVGGQGSERAISQIIDVINPEGTLLLLGVSENPVAVNTRMVLEKGLSLIGRSRSRREDFEEAVRILSTDPRFVRRMKALISEEIAIKSLSDISRAFDLARTVDFKVFLDWQI